MIANRKTGEYINTVCEGESIKAFVRLDVVREITGRRRGKVFVYSSYIEILNQGSEATL